MSEEAMVAMFAAKIAGATSSPKIKNQALDLIQKVIGEERENMSKEQLIEQINMLIDTGNWEEAAQLQNILDRKIAAEDNKREAEMSVNP